MQGKYIRQVGEPVWMPEIGLGIGREQGVMEGIEQEWLTWYTEAGQPYPLPEAAMAELCKQIGRLQKQLKLAQQQAEAERERAEAERERAEAELHRVEQLVARLIELGEDPETL